MPCDKHVIIRFFSKNNFFTLVMAFIVISSLKRIFKNKSCVSNYRMPTFFSYNLIKSLMLF